MYPYIEKFIILIVKEMGTHEPITEAEEFRRKCFDRMTLSQFITNLFLGLPG